MILYNSYIIERKHIAIGLRIMLFMILHHQTTIGARCCHSLTCLYSMPWSFNLAYNGHFFLVHDFFFFDLLNSADNCASNLVLRA